MKIIGFNFSKISAERKKAVSGKLDIKSNLEIEEIKKAEIDMIKAESALKLSFDFKILYEPQFAELDFKGFIIITLEEDKAKEALKSWKKKKIEDELRIPLFNIIMTKCNIKAIQLEEELALPTHVPFPRIQPQKEQ